MDGDDLPGWPSTKNVGRGSPMVGSREIINYELWEMDDSHEIFIILPDSY